MPGADPGAIAKGLARLLEMLLGVGSNEEDGCEGPGASECRWTIRNRIFDPEVVGIDEPVLRD